MVQKSRGRPRQFDEQAALAQAVRVFWARGFDAVTVDDLVASMAVGRPSLYAVFGDKAALFLRCLEAYGAQLGAGAAVALQAPTAHDAIAALLRYSVDHATRPDAPLGCLIACVAPLVDDDRVRDFVARASIATHAAVEKRIRTGVAAGELPTGFPVAKRTRVALDLSRGLVMRARMGAPRAELLRDAAEAAALVVS
ncbi:MAG TPA: TetR/AcrR family transcriptional regulator [Kofleriaceae bacterium]|jgi:AcrR family transcriptional regulator